MSWIKNICAKIEGSKICISEAIVIHTLNNLDLYFGPYLAILSHNTPQKKALPTLSELIKTLEDEQICLSNENKGTVNYTQGSKSKKAKSSKQKKEEQKRDPMMKGKSKGKR